MTAAAGYAELEDCSHLLGDRSGLDAFFTEHGYLLLRGVFPRSLAENLYEQVRAGLERQGARWVGPDDSTIVLPAKDIDTDALQRGLDFGPIRTDPELRALAEEVFGGPVYQWRSMVFRAIDAGREGIRAVPHQDSYFSDVNDDFRAFWTPLADLAPDTGGLAVVPGSHLGGQREVVVSDRRMPNGATFDPARDGDGAKSNDLFRTIPPENIEGTWSAASVMKRGDVIVQHAHLIHEGRPNTSRDGHVRLSMDMRFQPEASPRCVASQYTIPEFRTHLTTDENGRFILRDPQPTS